MSVGALITWPYKAGGRSRRGSPKAGTTVSVKVALVTCYRCEAVKMLALLDESVLLALPYSVICIFSFYYYYYYYFFLIVCILSASEWILSRYTALYK